MKKNAAFLLILFVLTPFSVRCGEQKIVENFSGLKVGEFPTEFRTYPFQRGKASRVYQVNSQDGNEFLHAKDIDNIATQIFRRFYWPIHLYTKFSWKWRAGDLPQGGQEDKPSANDSACSVYVVFGGYGGKAIKYVWSSSLPVGRVLEDDPGKFYIVIAESGAKNRGIWKLVTKDIFEDYKNLFHEVLTRNPSGFAILTDGDQTQSASSCDYDDFTLSS